MYVHAHAHMFMCISQYKEKEMKYRNLNEDYQLLGYRGILKFLQLVMLSVHKYQKMNYYTCTTAHLGLNGLPCRKCIYLYKICL